MKTYTRYKVGLLTGLLTLSSCVNARQELGMKCLDLKSYGGILKSENWKKNVFKNRLCWGATGGICVITTGLVTLVNYLSQPDPITGLANSNGSITTPGTKTIDLPSTISPYRPKRPDPDFLKKKEKREIEATKAIDYLEANGYSIENIEKMRKELKKKGLSINERDKDNQTIFYRLAITKASKQVFDYLAKDNETDVNMQYDHEETVLHELARSKQIDQLNSLLKLKNINVSIQNNKGQTALHIAVEHGFEKGVYSLLHHKKIKEFINITDKNEHTAYNIAKKYNKQKIAHMIAQSQKGR